MTAPAVVAVLHQARKTHSQRPAHHAKAPVTTQPAVHHRARSVTTPHVVRPTHAANAAAVRTPALPNKKTVTPSSKPNPTTTINAPPVAWTTFSDTFSEASPDPTMWNQSDAGTGASWALQNGRLEFTLQAGGTTGGRYDQIAVVYGTQCRLNGDFDARVNYQLLNWPSGNGSRVQLGAWVFPSTNSGAARVSTAAGEELDGNIASSWRSVPTGDQQGALRIARRSGVMTSYAQSGGKWVALESGTVPGQVSLGLSLFAVGKDWAHTDVSAAFDNFSLKAQNPSCP